jgi:exosortase N
LNLIFNQLRIIFLVVFNILPENPMHDAAGLAGLALYVFVPTWLGLHWAFGRTKNGGGVHLELPQKAPRASMAVVHLLLALGIAWFVFNESAQETSHVTDTAAIVPKGLPADCTIKHLQDGVVQYTRDSLLVYVKPIRGFYSTEHTPLICWQGSGYTFGKVWEQKIGKTLCYAGTLEKPGGPLLYTAWWFDNGKEQTISQARWRWLDAGGAPGFSLVNVTAPDRKTLELQLAKLVYGL